MQRYFLTLVTAALLLSGCNKDHELAAVEAIDVSNLPSFFASVPADTPYLYATLEPTPADLIDFFISKAQPMLDKAQGNLSQTLTQIENDQSQSGAVARAVLEEFDGKLSRAGLASLGISFQAHVLAYGYGPFPVIRLGIGDANAINELVARVMQKAGLEIQPQSFEGTDYWRFDEEEMGIVIAVLEDHIVFSALPSSLVDVRLPELLNKQQPAETLDVVTSIAKLNAENGYTPHGSGYLDFARISSLILDNDNPEATAMKAMVHHNGEVFSELCKAEFSAIASQFNRLETGYTEMSTERLGFNFVLDLEDTLASQLAALTVAGIGFNQDPGGLTSFALGLDLMQVRDWGMQLVAGRNANPYQCEHLQELNQQFADAEEKMNQPIPPFVGNFMGIRGRLDDVDLSTGEPTDVKGVFALATSNPEMLIGMAQMFLPSMAELTVTKNAEPVALPLAGLPVPEGLEHPYIAMSDNGIGISLGEGAQAGLGDFLENNGSESGTIFALGYDFGFYVEQISGTKSRGVDKPIKEIFDGDTMKFYTDLIDRQYNEVRLTSQGVEASQVITFK